VPIVFHFHALIDACTTTPFECSLQGDLDDSLWSCAR
jgi:hypothetical protein